MQQEGESQWAELGQKPSASSVRGENTICDRQRVYLAEAEVGTSLSSSRTLPVSVLESPRHPLLQNRASFPLVGMICGSKWWGRGLGTRFLHKPARAEKKNLTLAKAFQGPLPLVCSGFPNWCHWPLHSTPSNKDLTIKPICLTNCLGPEDQILPPRVLSRAWDRVVDVHLFWGRICWNLNPSLLLCIKMIAEGCMACEITTRQ